MKHLKRGKKFSRTSGQRKALLNNLAASLIIHDKIRTTLAKAKGVAPKAEKFISIAKKGGLPATRQLKRFLPDVAVKKLVSEIAVSYKDRQGGYTRILKLPVRLSDGAKMAKIELVK